MAFILATKTVLARDLWPGHLGSMVSERADTATTLVSAKVVPDDVEELTEWLSVDLQPELSQALVYIRSDVVGADTFGDHQDGLELIIRMQGVIAEVNLTVGGDWDGTEMNAIKATQSLTLVGGGCAAAFEPQTRALASVKETVLAMLGRSEEAGSSRSSTIVLKKRVFTKIRHGVNDDLPSVVKDAEDPRGKFRAIARSWRVTERVVAGTHLAHGEIFVIPALVLRKGDFVDVSVRVCVAILRGTNGKRYQVSFEPTAVIRLANPQQFMRAVRPVPVAAAGNERQVPVAHVPVRRAMPAGYTFAGDANLDADGDIVEEGAGADQVMDAESMQQ